MFKVARFYAGEAAAKVALIPRFLFIGNTAAQQEFEAEHIISGRAKGPMQRRAAMIRAEEDRKTARLAMGPKYASAYKGKKRKPQRSRKWDAAKHAGAPRSTMVAPPTKVSAASEPGSTPWTPGQAPSSSGAHSALNSGPIFDALGTSSRWDQLLAGSSLSDFVFVGQQFSSWSVFNGEPIGGTVWAVDDDGLHVMGEDGDLTFVGLDDLDNATIDAQPLADVIDLDEYRAARDEP